MAGGNQKGSNGETSNSKYSNALKLCALAYYDQDGRMTETSRAFNVPYSTIKDWITSRENGDFWDKNQIADPDGQTAIYKKALAAEMRQVMQLALKQVIDKLPKATAYQATTIFGILFDKVNILEGNGNPAPGGNLTINNTYINQMPDQEAERIMSKAIERMRGRAVDADFTVVNDQNNNGDNSSEPEI